MLSWPGLFSDKLTQNNLKWNWSTFQTNLNFSFWLIFFLESKFTSALSLYIPLSLQFLLKIYVFCIHIGCVWLALIWNLFMAHLQILMFWNGCVLPTSLQMVVYGSLKYFYGLLKIKQFADGCTSLIQV